MKIATRHVLGICVLGILGCASAGCATDATDGTGAAKGATGDTAVLADGQPTDKAVPAKDALPGQEGLTIVKSDPQWGLKAVFKDADRALLIERRVGLPRLAEKLAENPKLGAFEDDVMVTNEAGQVIMIQQGGDELVDPTWKDRFDESVKEPLDVAKRTAELALLDRATEQLLAAPEALEASARGSIEGMRNVARRPLDSFRKESDTMSYGPGYNGLEIHSQVILGGTAHHTATWGNYSGTVWITCNHGSCANGGDMPYKCATYQHASNAALKLCSTPYVANSFYGHNCHDDTVLQLWSFKYSGTAYSDSSGVCNNGLAHTYGPECTTDSW